MQLSSNPSTFGGALLITGVSLIIVNANSFGFSQTSTSAGVHTKSNAAGIGIVISIAAIPVLITGIYQWTRGHDNYKYYKPMIEPKDAR